MKVPRATSDAPRKSTRPAPTLSATAPAKGCVRPHHSWPKAKARLMLPTPRPVAVLSGLRNSPVVWRVPMVRAKVRAAASSTSQNIHCRRCVGLALVIGFSIGNRGQQVEAFFDQAMQLDDAARAEHLVDALLRHSPAPLCLLTFF